MANNPINVADRAIAQGEAWQAFFDAVDLQEAGEDIDKEMVKELGNAAQYVTDQYSASYQEWQDNYEAWQRDQWPVSATEEAAQVLVIGQYQAVYEGA